MGDKYLEGQFRGRIIGPIIAFREYIFSNVLPAFGNIDARANQVANDFFNHRASQPAGEYEEIDMADVAEAAQDYSHDWYAMMTSLRQSMLNLLAAGLFHLVEQQLGSVSRDSSFSGYPLSDTKLSVVAAWYRKYLGPDIEKLPSWDLIKELRLVANTVKHAEGGSADELRKLRPELFSNPAYAEIYKEYGPGFDPTEQVISAPLSGEDFFVTEELLRRYAAGAESFFAEIAEYFRAAE